MGNTQFVVAGKKGMVILIPASVFMASFLASQSLHLQMEWQPGSADLKRLQYQNLILIKG